MKSATDWLVNMNNVAHRLGIIIYKVHLGAQRHESWYLHLYIIVHTLATSHEDRTKLSSQNNRSTGGVISSADKSKLLICQPKTIGGFVKNNYILC